MCGITAMFAYGPAAAPIQAAELDAVTDRMAPRGPDARGTWISPDGRVGLGSRRLAIIDLSPEGVQPMFDVDRELVIVFNGEIYNHKELRERLERNGARFHSHSDTEVLLQLYRHDGPRMVELLRGMYGFAIWDTRVGRMFVARDPYGIKPLYFADDGRTFRCASTVKALLAGGAVSRAIDPAGMAGFLLMGSVPEPFTIHEAIRSVEAGTSFFVGAEGRENVRRHYSIAGILRDAVPQKTVADLVAPETMLRELVTESLQYHLVSDVPVGAFLSSGIDSAALVAMTTEMRRDPLRTVTLSFEEFKGQSSDEAPLADSFAASLGITNNRRVVTKSEFLAELPKFFDAMDQPTIDGLNTYFVSKAASELGLKVAISGLGGDELFGSYGSFSRVPMMIRALTTAARLPLGRAGLKAAIKVASRSGRATAKMRAIPRYGSTYPGAYLLQRGLFLPEDLPSVMGANAAEEGLARLDILSIINKTIEPDPGTPYGRVAALEASLYMRNQLLRDTDWASMAHSVEVRTPLVDASLLRQLAPLLLMHGAECKQLLARSPRKPLPDSIRNRPKTGFLTPIREWVELPPDHTSTRMRSWSRMVLEHWR